MAFILFMPPVSHATEASHPAEIEAAAGGWLHEPSGSLSYLGEALDLRSNLNFTNETDIDARLKVHLPALLPDMYLMATFLKFQGENTLSQPFVFGAPFQAGKPFSAETRLNHFDIAAIYSLIPAHERGLFNAHAGINLRVIHLQASITQGGQADSFTDTFAVPLIYLGARLRASSLVRLEAEARGMALASEHYLDLIGRVKFFVLKPLFVAAGYRYEQMKIARHGFNMNAGFGGPFVEAGFDL